MPAQPNQVIGSLSEQSTPPDVTNVPMCGPQPLLDVQLEGHLVTALVDTGSQVSTITSTFYNEHLKDKAPAISTPECFTVYGITGHAATFEGCALIDVTVADQVLPTPFLIVPPTKFGERHPALLGTNVLSRLTEATSDSVVRQAIRCINKQRAHLSRTNGVYSHIYTSKRTVVPKQSAATVSTTTRFSIEVPHTVAYLHQVVSAAIPQQLQVTPGVVSISPTLRNIDIEVCNPTQHDIILKPGVKVAELLQATVEPPTPSSRIDELEKELGFDELASRLTTSQLADARSFVKRWAHMFSSHDLDIGRTSVVKHRIDLLDDQPFKDRSRRIPPAMFEEVRQHLQTLLDNDVIRESTSPWSSNMVLVRKKDGRLRLCVDYRRLNSQSKLDSYNILSIDEILDTLGGNRWFSSLDLCSGYHQVEIEEEHKERTAFQAGPLGFYEYNRMPFGLTNSPATFQRLMDRVLGDLYNRGCISFLDDCLAYSIQWQTHLSILEECMTRLQKANLKLRGKKCELFRNQLLYLGHRLSEEGIQVDDAKLEPVKSWPTPSNVKQLQQFLGFVGFYRKFIQDFAKIAQPLFHLLGGRPSKANKAKPSKPTPEWDWGATQNAAFHKLKQALLTPPILAYPDFKKPFLLRTDASKQGLGAVLYQEQDGKDRVISYASRSLKPAELNYSGHKLEFTALRWAITVKFKSYLYGHHFTVTTDNNPLTYVLSTAKLDATGHRWLTELQDFHFDIKYKPGRSNQDADILSRIEHHIPADSIKALGKASDGFAESLGIEEDQAQVLPEDPTLHQLE